MELKDFDYSLPQNLIAQHPLEGRDSSRLMVLERSSGTVAHRSFRDVKEYLTRNDTLALNDTKVIPARLHGRKNTGGAVEVFLVRPARAPYVWLCMMKNSKGLKPGSRIYFDKGIEAAVLGKNPEDFWECSFKTPSGREDFYEEIGSVPLPPYIKRRSMEDDKTRYQTEFARAPGAVAAPTAGLHFTKALLSEMADNGVSLQYVTLHTGPGTFLPVKTEDMADHRMHKEFYSIRPEVFSSVLDTRRRGGRVVAAGTTVVRALEASVKEGVEIPVLSGYTDLFVRPGFEFKIVDALITNFHLPRSTLLMLVCAFAGRKNVLAAYNEAVREKYRFFSYGDAMLII